MQGTPWMRWMWTRWTRWTWQMWWMTGCGGCGDTGEVGKKYMLYPSHIASKHWIMDNTNFLCNLLASSPVTIRSHFGEPHDIGTLPFLATNSRDACRLRARLTLRATG